MEIKEVKLKFHLASGLISIKQTSAHYKININLTSAPQEKWQKGHSEKFKQFYCQKNIILITDIIN